MKFWSILVAVLVMALGASLVMAEGNATTKPFRGQIKAIDGANVTVGTTTIVTDSKTTVTNGDGEKAALSDLAVGQVVAVTLAADGKTATAIAIAKHTIIQVPIGGG